MRTTDSLAEMLSRFADVSEAAVRACESNDIETINRALDAREALLGAMQRAPSGTTWPAAVLRSRVARVRESSDALQRALTAVRDDIGRQLAELEHQRSALLHYQAPERVSSLDVRR